MYVKSFALQIKFSTWPKKTTDKEKPGYLENPSPVESNAIYSKKLDDLISKYIIFYNLLV